MSPYLATICFTKIEKKYVVEEWDFNNLKYERQKHLESRFDELEHLWVKLPGRNKNCSLLLGVIYRSPNFTNPSSWLPKFEELLSYVKSTWDGKLMITGDFNLDLLRTSKP